MNESPETPQSHWSTLEVARQLGLAVRSVQLMVDRGELDAWKTPGGHRRISRLSVELWMAQRRVGAGTGATVAGGLQTPATRALSARPALPASLAGPAQVPDPLPNLLPNLLPNPLPNPSVEQFADHFANPYPASSAVEPAATATAPAPAPVTAFRTGDASLEFAPPALTVVPSVLRIGDGSAADRGCVLVIEDSKHYQNLVSLLLRENFPQLDVKLADDGIAGLAMVGYLRPRILIVDILLPGIDGATLITSLRSHPQFANCGLLVITSLDDAGLAPYRFALDGVTVVHKSHVVIELPQHVRRLLAVAPAWSGEVLTRRRGDR